jgi:predicted transcriptional regulator
MALMQGIRSGIEASNKILIMVTEENSEKATAMNRYHACGFGAGLLAGAVIGGAIAFLYAPKTGKEMRQIIKDKATEVAGAVKDAASEVSRKGQDAVHVLKS